MTATFFFCALLCTGIALILGEYTITKPNASCAEAMGVLFSIGFGIVSLSCLFGFVFCLYAGA